MNKIGNVALAATLALAAVPSARAAAPPLKAGAAVSNITLPLGASIGGTIARGGAVVHVHDELHARCLVLDDGKVRLALVVCDLRMIGREVVGEAKELIQEATRLSPDHVMISATHTHAAPAVIGIHTADIDQAYSRFLARRIADAVQRAVNNLSPARVGWGNASAPEHVFNRRWHMKEGTVPPNPFGEKTDRVRMNPPRGSEDLLRPAGPVDPQVGILAVRHADGRPLALLGNYGLHYVGGYQAGHLSADYFGIFSSRVGELLKAEGQDPPFVGILSNGTSGDVNNIDFHKRTLRLEPWVKMREVADDIARKAVAAEEGIKYQDRVSLAAAATELRLGVRKPDAKRLAWARKVVAGIQAGKALTRPQIYAQEALSLAKYPDTVPVKLQAFRIGELGIAQIPCEVFAETGLAIKEKSPLPATFTIELANGYNGYLPTPEQHELGGYETWPARSSYLEVDSETKIRAAVLGLLKEVAGK